MITPHDIPGIGHDLFRRGGGVGLPGHDALVTIVTAGPSTTANIATEIKFKPDAVRRALKALADSGIVERSPHGTWSIVSTDWNGAADVVGTSGKAERQRLRHAREQEARRKAVAAWIEQQRNTPPARTDTGDEPA